MKGEVDIDLVKTVLIVIAALVGLAILYAYIKHLFEEGYDEEEIYLHIFRDVPLRFLKRNKQNVSDYSGYALRKKSPSQHTTVDYDSYPSYYGSNCDPEIAALMNKSPADLEHNKRILKEGGWKCACGRVNAAYVSSCVCGKSKQGESAPQTVQKSENTMDDDKCNMEIANAAAIREYKELMDDGIISTEEFEAKKKQLLNL